MVDNWIRKVDFILAVFFCLFSYTSDIYAQTGAEDYLVVNRLTRESGLPDQDINGLFFDSKGYAWISTFGGGLVRYDGDSFLNFTRKNDPETISDIVSQCREDRYGRLWIPGAGGMDILDLNTLTLLGDFPGMTKAWRHTHSPAALRTDAKGCMWFTSNDVLFRVAFLDDGNRFQVDSLLCPVTNDNLIPKPGDVEYDGSMWITLGGHFYKVRAIEGKGLRMSEILPGVDIGAENRATAYLRNGNDVWVGTMDGLYRIDILTGQYVSYRHAESDSHSLPNNEVTGLCISPDNEIVVATLGGVSIYNPVSHTFDTYGARTNDFGNQILPGEIVRGIATRGRQIWVGLEAEGLVILQKKSLQITNLSRIETTSGSLPSTPVRALFIDRDDDLWLATTGFGLCRRVNNLVFRNSNTENSALAGNSITTFCEDRDGRIWFGTVDGHVNYVSKASPDVVRVPEGATSEVARNIDVILGMVYDSVHDYVWITARNGLYIYDLGESNFRAFPGISTCLTACIVSGGLWVSTIEGMRVIDLETLESRLIEGIPVCMSLIPDGDTIWAGTYGNGVCRVDDCLGEKPGITFYSENDGLADNQVNGLLLDGIYLWITTENGLSRLDTQTGELSSFGIDDGLKSMSFCENSIAKGRDGTIYMGLKGGGLSLLRSSYIPNDFVNKPEIVISGYYAKDLFHSLAYSESVGKDEKDTDFTLKFSDLSYGTGTDVTYESRIWPLEKDWSPTFRNDTHLQFGHIPGGNYRIQVRAVDKNGKVLSQDEKGLNVRPVVYKRWWFILLLLLLLGALVHLFLVWNTKAISRKKDLLQQEVDRQTKILKEQKEELERKAEALAEQNALLQKQNEMIASQNTLTPYSSTNRETADFSAALLETIQKMYKDPDLDVHQLADAMGMSRSQLNEKIQGALGLSIAQFIRTFRLNVAKEMICNGTNEEMNISEIAYEVGFNDPKYFTRCFTKEFNCPPSDLHHKKKD